MKLIMKKNVEGRKEKMDFKSFLHSGEIFRQGWVKFLLKTGSVTELQSV